MEGWVKLPDQNYVNMDGYLELALTLLVESFQVLRYVPFEFGTYVYVEIEQ